MLFDTGRSANSGELGRLFETSVAGVLGNKGAISVNPGVSWVVGECCCCDVVGMTTFCDSC